MGQSLRDSERHADGRVAALSKSSRADESSLLHVARPGPRIPPRHGLWLRLATRLWSSTSSAHPHGHHRGIPSSRTSFQRSRASLSSPPHSPRAKRRKPHFVGCLRFARSALTPLGSRPLLAAQDRCQPTRFVRASIFRRGTELPSFPAIVEIAKPKAMERATPFLTWPGWRHLHYAALLSFVNTLWFVLVYGGVDGLTPRRTFCVPVLFPAVLPLPFFPPLACFSLSI